MQVQWRSDDTQKWGQGFGRGTDGIYTPSTSTDNPVKTTFSGTSNALTGTVGSATNFSVGDIVIIHQSRNGGGGAGIWMFNYIIGISGTTFTLLYNLVDNFNTTAQIQRIPQYSEMNLASGVVLTGSSWNSTTGGILIPGFVNGPINIVGNISCANIGYAGGSANQVDRGAGFRGEGTLGDATTQSSLSAGNAGGGGQGNTSVGTQPAAGSGGNGTAGTESGGNPGSAGNTSGNVSLTIATFGGGSGGGGTNQNGLAGERGGSGGNGGALVMLIGRTITVTGTINAGGGKGGDATGGSSGNGSGGAGGSILFKGQTINLGSNLVTASGGLTGSGGGVSGNVGAVGRIHADYTKSFTGTTTPNIDITQDNSFLDSGGVQIIG